MPDLVSFFQIGKATNELSSIQSQTPAPAGTPTQTSSGSTDCMIEGGSSTGGAADLSRRNSTGLLGDLLEESQPISRSKRSNQKKIPKDDHGLMENSLQVFRVGHAHDSPILEEYRRNFVSAPSNIGINERKEVTEEIHVMDDDLLHLLDCPSPVPISDWYDAASNNIVSNAQPSNVTDYDRNVGTDYNDQREGQSRSPAVTTTSDSSMNHNWDEDSCCWNNMLGVLY